MMFYIKRVMNGLRRRFWYLLNFWKFKKMGKGSYILKKMIISGYKRISIDNNVYIASSVWLSAIPHTGNEMCEIEIGEGTMLGNFNHIYATKSIKIGDNVLTADKVYISDNLHSYEDVSRPILKQPIKQIGTVEIGSGSWIGENVCIIGANIGKNSVIGANSVVIKDIPDYSVAVGSPAKVIKRYCFEDKLWKKTDKDGFFLQEKNYC